MDPIGIWFTQGFSNLFQALNDIRGADAQGAYKLVCSHPHPEFVGRQAADVFLREPTGLSDADYLEFVLATARQHNVRVIFPSRKQGFMNKYAKRLAENGIVVATVAPSTMLARIDNKGRLYRYLSGKGLVELPEFHCVKDATGFNKVYRALKRRHERLCVKPTVGVYGSGFRVLKDGPNTLADLVQESLDMSVTDLRARLRTSAGAELMVMQYLEGDERSVDCLAFNGELVGGVVRRKSASSVAAQIIEDRPDLLAQVRSLVKALRLNGMFNVQFKDTRGVANLLEINPRLSGRSYYATIAGLNIPFLAAELFSGRKSLADMNWALKTGLLIANVASAVPLEGVVRGRRTSASVKESA